MITFSQKRKIVEWFMLLFNKKAESFYFDLSMVEFISWRKLFKIFKYAFIYDNIEFDKHELKLFVKLLKKQNFNINSKSEINSIYKLISKHDFYNIVDFDEIFKKVVFVVEHINDVPTKISTYNLLNKYLYLGVLRI